MKQMKIFLVAVMTVVMGVSVTSCMKGENNTIQSVSGIITLVNTFPYQFQVENSNVIFEASTMTVPGLSNDASSGDIVLLQSQYDTEKQPVDNNTKKIIVDVAAAIKLNGNTASVTNDVTPNRTIIPLRNYGVEPYLYSANWIIIPMPFYVEKSEKESSHMFYLVYDKAHSDNNANTMVLRLRHVSSEDVKSETSVRQTYKAFNIKNVVSAFEGEQLKSIKIITQEQKGNSPEIAEGSTDAYTEQTYVINDYNKFVK